MSTYTPRPGSNIDKLLNAIKAAAPFSIRTDELSKKTGVSACNIAASLSAAVSLGIVTVCKVIKPGSKKELNEYRLSAGIPMVGVDTYTTPKRGPIPVRSHMDAPQSQPRGPQPEVGSNTGSASSGQLPEVEAPQSEGRAVSTPPAPKADKAQAPAGKRHKPYFATDTEGSLVIDLPSFDAPLIMTPAEHQALRQFINATPGVLA